MTTSLNSSPPRTRVDRIIEGYTHWIIKARWLVLLATLAVCTFAGLQATGIGFSSNYRIYFSDENPELIAFEGLQDTYSKTDNLFFMVRHRDGGDVFRPEVMTAVEEMTEAGWQIPFATRVDSLTNFQHSYAFEDDLVVEPLIGSPSSLSADAYAERRSIALSEPLLNGLLVTADADATAVNVVVQYPEVDADEVSRTAMAGRALRDDIEARYPELTVELTGVSMLNTAFTESSQKDFTTLVPAMFLIVLLLTYLTIRSVSAVIAVMVLVLASMTFAFGVGGVMGVLLTPISMSAAIVVLTLAVADSIHILLSMRGSMQDGMSKHDALVEAVRINFLAVLITSVTTAVGFLALNFSDSPPFWHLGNMAAVGIVGAWALSVTFLPAILAILPFRVAEKEGQRDGPTILGRFGEFVVSHYRVLALGSAIAAVALIAMIPRIQTNDQWAEYFLPPTEFRVDSDLVSDYFGLYPVEFSVPSGEAGGVSDPDYLRRLDAFAQWLRERPEIAHVYSVSDIMKRINRNLNSDDPAFYRLPESREVSAQNLLLYELSLPYGLDLNDRINVDKSATRLTARLGNTNTQATQVLIADARDYVAAHFPPDQQAAATSTQVMFTYIAQRNIEQMIEGTTIAFIAISIIMIIALRSVKLGLLSIVPNALPIAAAFGVWAIVVGEVGFSISVVAAIGVGIVVDDTVHLMTKYLRARRERGLSPKQAVVFAIERVGLALVVNTTILMIGFGVMLASTFKPIVDMGFLTMSSIGFALIFDFLLLPGLLILLDRGQRGPTSSS